MHFGNSLSSDSVWKSWWRKEAVNQMEQCFISLSETWPSPRQCRLMAKVFEQLLPSWLVSCLFLLVYSSVTPESWNMCTLQVMGENEIQESAGWVSTISVWKLPLLHCLLTFPQFFSICQTILPSASQQKVLFVPVKFRRVLKIHVPNEWGFNWCSFPTW